jgi:hypothetical protein
MRNLLTGLMLSLLGVVSFGIGACDDVDAAFDCQKVCSRYKDCIDSNFDSGACRDRCRDRAAADDDKRRQADVCEACIDGMSCTSATVRCATECASIISG